MKLGLALGSHTIDPFRPGESPVNGITINKAMAPQRAKERFPMEYIWFH